MVNSLLFPDSDPGGLWGPYDDHKGSLKRAFLAAQSAPKQRQINDRGLVAPFVGYDDGSWDWGVPGLLWGPWEAAKEMSKDITEPPFFGPGGAELSWYDENGNIDPETARKIEGAGQIVGAAMMGGVAVPRAGNIATLASKNARIFDPPSRPQRPFERDYPSGAMADETGRLTNDIEGRTLNPSARVVGRRVVGGEDQAIPPAEFDTITEALTGRIAQIAPAREMGQDAGRALLERFTGKPTGVYLRNNLSPEQAPRVFGHELGHVVDAHAAGVDGIPATGILRNELQPSYNSLNNPNRQRLPDGTWGDDAASWSKPVTPETFGYKGDDVGREYIAEAIRAYMANPNYLKTEAPETAARIREYVNENPRLNKVIQFNANAPPARSPRTRG